MRFSKKIVAMVIMLNVAFVVAVFYAVLKSTAVPDSLIVAWFSFTTAELWSLSTVSREKIRQPEPGQNKEEGTSNDY